IFCKPWSVRRGKELFLCGGKIWPAHSRNRLRYRCKNGHDAVFASCGILDPEETSPGRGTSRGEIRDPLLSDADRFYRGGSPFSAKSSPISIRWSLNLERTLRHL